MDTGPVENGYLSKSAEHVDGFLSLCIWVASNYAVYSTSTEFCAGAVPSTFSINLLIPYYVGSPIINLSEYCDWVCSSTLEICLRNKWSLRSSIISDWSTGPFSTHFPWETPLVDEDQEFDRILAAVRLEDESLWVPFSAPSLETEVEDMVPPGIPLTWKMDRWVPSSLQ
ncbi:hypothetical protein HWV62_19311 [Athelia sp. TMB]|nr:hypothetical protein HWV62_19311 [Athelia sp. TMB]